MRAFPTNLSTSGWQSPKFWASCRMCYGAVSLNWDGHQLASSRDARELAPNTNHSCTNAQAPMAAEDADLTSSFNMTGSCPRWQLCWGRFEKNNPRLAGGYGTMGTENPSQGGGEAVGGGRTMLRLQVPKTCFIVPINFTYKTQTSKTKSL